MDLARFVWELLGALILTCFETVVLQADVVLDCGATETARESRQCRFWWMQ